ncbi:DUF4344 domain-containing metallopeptidase [Streptomyces sp. NPDC048361]|uniref:DUF4344 domain-containing metallopeptidase n=1 Tax=Streptomyces sp. NPDC048361 TaxID=3154720 RepID=UPI0034278F92
MRQPAHHSQLPTTDVLVEDLKPVPDNPVMAPRGIRHILAAGLSATLLLSCTTNGGDSRAPDPARPSGSGFAIRYEEPTAADRPSASFLRERNTIATATQALNALLTLNQQITVASRSCNGEGSAYDPQTRTIELCYDDTTEDRALFQNAGRHPADDETAAIATETLYHEAAHALIDLLDLPLTNRQEEDAADQFAALMLLRSGPTGEHQLRTAAEAYELTSATDDRTDSRDEHSPNQVRAANHLCYLYGAAPPPQQRPHNHRPPPIRTRNHMLTGMGPGPHSLDDPPPAPPTDAVAVRTPN